MCGWLVALFQLGGLRFVLIMLVNWSWSAWLEVCVAWFCYMLLFYLCGCCGFVFGWLFA